MRSRQASAWSWCASSEPGIVRGAVVVQPAPGEGSAEPELVSGGDPVPLCLRQQHERVLHAQRSEDVTAEVSLLSAPRSVAERAMGAKRATLLYSSDADHVGDVAVVDAPISEGDTDATSTR